MGALTLIATDLTVCDCCQSNPVATICKDGLFFSELCRSCAAEWDVQMAASRRAAARRTAR